MEVILIKENNTFLPMLFLSGQQSKEVSYENSIHREQRSYIFLSAGVAFGHESYFHGPLFSTLAALGHQADPPGLKTIRSRRWTLEYVVYVSLLMALESSRTLKDRFAHARQGLVEMFPCRKRPGGTYQGYVKARGNITRKQLQAIQDHLRGCHRRIAGSFWRRDGWLAFSADGTRVEVPRTIQNEEALGCAGRSKTGPQLSLTSLYHLGTGLPWAWQIGAGPESEQTHLRRLAALLPAGSLLVADAGFTGFDLLKELLDRRVHFLVRMGSNRTLLKGLQDVRVRMDGEVVWLWPKRRQSTCPPLRLRLLRIEEPNRSPVYLVTSVMDEVELTDQQIGEFYRMRWGQEVFYRSFKRTLEQYKMRSGSARQAHWELEWAMMAYLTIGLLSVEALVEDYRDPLMWSPAGSLRVVRRAMRYGGRFHRRGNLQVLLKESVKDGYRRSGSKKARNWPHKKNELPPGVPIIREANEKEKNCAKKTYGKSVAA